MARLLLDVSELAGSIELALAHLGRGDAVYLEHEGRVVARLAPAESVTAAVDPFAELPPAVRDLLPRVDGAPAQPADLEKARDVLGAHLAGMHAAMDEWDELAREEALLEMLAEDE